MANSRAKGQVLIGTWCNEEFVAQIDACRRHQSRSQFCRDALREKLEADGFIVPIDRAFPPDRTGKGRPKMPTVGNLTYKDKPLGGWNINEKGKLSSAKEPVSTTALKTAVAGFRASPISAPSRATDEPSAKTLPPKPGIARPPKSPRKPQVPVPNAPVSERE